MSKVVVVVFFIFSVSWTSTTALVADGMFSQDENANCSKRTSSSLCYNGPRFETNIQFKSCKTPGSIALTFDDGPDAIGTPMILDIAKKYDMKLTFFVIGKKFTAALKPVLQRIIDEGHQLASHTYTHPWLTSLSASNQEKDLIMFERALNGLDLKASSKNGFQPRFIPNYLRAPRGAINTDTINIAKKLGYKLVHWGYLNGDTKTEYIVRVADVLPIHMEHMGGMNGTNVTPDIGLIVQQHDNKNVTYISFESVANYFNSTFRSRGVKFVTIAECLGNIAPFYRDNPRKATDPSCSKGIKADGACCSKTCGRCGGNNCSSLPGAANECCPSNILRSGIYCKYTTAPCIM